MCTTCALVKKRCVLCVGVCILNVVHNCQDSSSNVNDINLSEGFWQRGGKASNNCTVLSHLGTKCEFFGVLSQVPAFSFIIDNFKELDIEIRNCPMVNVYQPYSSILSCRPTGMFTILHTDMGFPILRFRDFRERINLDNYKWIHFEGQNPWETKYMINMVRRYNQIYQKRHKRSKKPITISVELSKPNVNLIALAIRSDVIFVGREFASNLGFKSPKETVYGFREFLTITQLREEKDFTELDLCFHCAHIICPWGEEGVDILTSDYKYYHVPPAFTTNVVDNIGSGDVFVAGVIHGLTTLKVHILEAVQLGNRLATYKMQHRGFDYLKKFRNSPKHYL